MLHASSTRHSQSVTSHSLSFFFLPGGACGHLNSFCASAFFTTRSSTKVRFVPARVFLNVCLKYSLAVVPNTLSASSLVSGWIEVVTSIIALGPPGSSSTTAAASNVSGFFSAVGAGSAAGSSDIVAGTSPAAAAAAAGLAGSGSAALASPSGAISPVAASGFLGSGAGFAAGPVAGPGVTKMEAMLED